MTYRLRKNVPFVQYARRIGNDYATYQKSYGSTSTPSSLTNIGLPANLSARDIIHVRAGLKEGGDGQGMVFHITDAQSSWANVLASGTIYLTITLASPDDYANRLEYPVSTGSGAVTSAMATAAASATAFRTWVGADDTDPTSAGMMSGLVGWVEMIG